VSNWPPSGGWNKGYRSQKRHVRWRAVPTFCSDGGGRSAREPVTSFPAMANSVGRRAGLPSWNGRSANRRWRSIFEGVLAAHRGTADATGTDWKSAVYRKVQEEVKADRGLIVLSVL